MNVTEILFASQNTVHYISNSKSKSFFIVGGSKNPTQNFFQCQQLAACLCSQFISRFRNNKYVKNIKIFNKLFHSDLSIHEYIHQLEEQSVQNSNSMSRSK